MALIGNSKEDVEEKLELWRQTLESKGFKLSITKTEYLKCDLSDSGRVEGDILLDGQPVPRKESFRYLGSILQSNEDILHRTQSGLGKWCLDSGILCDRKVPLKLKGKFYKSTIRPSMLYGAECWAINSRDTLRLKSTEMRMLRWAWTYEARPYQE
ncbi:uncharacterized protein LOC113272727 [Papaver somniferum]|uniref:uncharacterized protein LOC113272727 n=1 Tax=Papaver somniferum TaxID=3469 RepID=UPI000E6FD93E|nr:uncharacterized protein LOC113272727 [Papaver somniferum]